MYMVKGKDEAGERWIFTGSHGGQTASSIDHNRLWSNQLVVQNPERYRLYRFTGNKKDIRAWMKDYSRKYNK